PVRSLLAHPTQPWVISGSQDGQLQLWASPPPNCAPRLSGQAIAQAQTMDEAIVALRYLPLDRHQTPQVLCLTATGHLTGWQFPVGF
ncbi:MAG: WD40 repeat domain-containing protein, partial [Cyanobacteria bacterium P01_H01_bin.153]